MSLKTTEKRIQSDHLEHINTDAKTKRAELKTIGRIIIISTETVEKLKRNHSGQSLLLWREGLQFSQELIPDTQGGGKPVIQ